LDPKPNAKKAGPSPLDPKAVPKKAATVKDAATTAAGKKADAAA
jgi:hypothetical protein